MGNQQNSFKLPTTTTVPSAYLIPHPGRPGDVTPLGLPGGVFSLPSAHCLYPNTLISAARTPAMRPWENIGVEMVRQYSPEASER